MKEVSEISEILKSFEISKRKFTVLKIAQAEKETRQLSTSVAAGVLVAFLFHQKSKKLF